MLVKTILFDLDGVVIKREEYFSDRFSKDFNVDIHKILPFFKNEFQSCLAGKADLRVELAKYLPIWGWTKSVDDLLEYWFSAESRLDPDILGSVKELREKGHECFIQTSNANERLIYLKEKTVLERSFDGIFASCDLGVLKPDFKFWEAVYQKLPVKPIEEILVIDDDQDNIDSANKFGFKTHLFQNFEAYQENISDFLA